MKRNLIFQSIIIPIAILVAFTAFPDLDVASPQPVIHFYLVTFFTFVAVVVALLVGITLGANSPVRHSLLATAGAGMGIIFFVHGITTPQALTYIINPGIRWGGWLTLFVGSLLFVVASFDTVSKPLQTYQLRLINICVIIISLTFCLIAAFMPQWLTAVDENISPWHQRAAYYLTLIAWIIAAWRLKNLWQTTGNRLDGVMALIATWLAIATVSQYQFSIWQLSWWIYHILLLNAAITAAYYLLSEYEQTRQFSLTRYYAITSLVVMAALALLTSYISSQVVQREREDFLRQQAITLGQQLADSLDMSLPAEATTSDLNTLLAMPGQSLSLLLQGELLSVDVDAIRIFDTQSSLIYEYKADETDNELELDDGRYQQAINGEINVYWQNSVNRTAANVPTTLVQTYIPIQTGNTAAGVLIFEQEVSGLNESVLAARRNGLVITLSATGVLFLALLGIVRRANHLIMVRSNELANAYANLQAAEAMREDLTDMIVHDLRSPLTAVEISLQLLQKSSSKSQETRERLLTSAHNSLQRAVDLTNDILNVAKLEEGKLELSPTLFDIRQLLQERADFYCLQGELEQKHVETTLPPESINLHADRELITRVLDNLISNAFKYIRRGGHVQLTACPKNNYLQIEVSDDGEGISPENARRIFDKFVQVKGKREAIRRGTGLGLTFCRLVIEAHGGQIWVESDVGKGSTFYFTLPL